MPVNWLSPLIASFLISNIVEWYKLLHLRLVPWFFPPRAAVMLASWGWNRLGAQPWEHRIRGLAVSADRHGLPCTTIWSHCMVIAMSRAAGQQVLVACADCYLLSAGHASALFFLAAAHLVELVVVVTQIQTDQLLLPTMVSLLQGWQWRAWKLQFAVEQSKLLGSSNIMWKQSGVKNASVPNSYSLIKVQQ